MKMDIEGSDYHQLLPELMTTGALCHVNTIVLEVNSAGDVLVVPSLDAVAAVMGPVMRWLDGAVPARHCSVLH